MTTTMRRSAEPSRLKPALPLILIVAGLAAFSLTFLVLDTSYNRFADARFPSVGTSTSLANVWGIVSRAHLLALMVPFVIWRPKALGFRLGNTRDHWRLLIIMLVANCGVIAGYLWLTNSSTPYSGNQWLLTEIVTVPVVEEVFWRGLVFAGLLWILRRSFSQRSAEHLTVLLSGLAFGLLHAGNALSGVPLAFVGIQVLNASIWGIVYAYARSKTGSLYPPLILHAAMNTVVILF